ncbi:methylmalonyl-CoA mutase family protein [Nocardioides zeae]|uniref:Methylmalonyl-CoA mutase family protein n=1 Tax=Nocardioides imazamoxiresistens TaxID=3231893 RepID=A0ABU3PU49_9ACTN|nr:methylmalonyl-CoA mutase family protein [Nocardioides zeae]MDT9592758.1 methylmalonyl-CoA mutase family protein [Nocardioides zeae]
MTEVEGGLDEPAELQPEQGALALADPATDAWTQADWETETARVLRKARRLGDDDPDAGVWEKLTRTTLDGIALPPIGRPSDLDGVPVEDQRPRRAGGWDIRAHLGATAVPAKAANETALVDLEGGVTSLWLRVDAGADLATLLDGVFLDLAAVVLEAPREPGAAVDVARAFLAHLEATRAAEGTNLGVDALAPADDVVAVARLAHEAGLLGVVVDATAVHDAGASDAQELAYSLAVGVRALRLLTAPVSDGGAGLDVTQAARLLEFRLAVTDEQFTSIAKLRAARRLWARVLELSGADGSPAGRVEQRQHAVTSRPMTSRFDPYVNVLRTTVAAFAGGVGGADAVTVLPFDAPLGRPEVLGRRVARNISHLLIDESHLGKVADIAGGAYAVERLTDDLATAAWTVFTETEGADDLDAAFAPLVEATVAERERQVATRKRPLTGLSEFPDLAETLPERVRDADWHAEWDRVRPYGASFEALRDAPAATPVFLATLGPVAAHTARATFATNLLAAGGVGVVVAGATADAEAVAEAYRSAVAELGALPVVTLAGADATYAEWGAAAAAALREAGATRVVVAGKAQDHTDDACGVGVDALAFLARTRSALGAGDGNGDGNGADNVGGEQA